MRRAWLALAALAGAPAASAAGDVPAPRTDVQVWDVDAGTRGALVEDHRVPLVRLRIAFPAGTWSPWFRQRHVEEAFGIQLYDSDARLRREADRLAADLSLPVEERSSSLVVACRTEDLDAVIELVKRVLGNRDFDRAELKRRSAARRLEWQAAQREPDFVLWQAADRAYFTPRDPRRRAHEKPDRYVTDAAKLAAARDALVRLPGRVIGWAGDITRADAERRSKGLLPPVDPAVPADLAPVFDALSDPAAGTPRTASLRRLTQVYFGLTRPGLGMTHPDAAALLIADHVLGGHFYSRLYRALRHEGGDTYGAATRRTGEVAPGLYMLWTFTKTANARATEQKLRGVLDTLHASGITEQERAAAAGYLTGREAFERQAPGQILDRWLWEVERGLPPGFRDEFVGRAARLPLAEINAFIRRFYEPAGFRMFEVVPKDKT